MVFLERLRFLFTLTQAHKNHHSMPNLNICKIINNTMKDFPSQSVALYLGDLMTHSISAACLTLEMTIIITIIEHFPGLLREITEIMLANCMAQIPGLHKCLLSTG